MSKKVIDNHSEPLRTILYIVSATDNDEDPVSVIEKYGIHVRRASDLPAASETPGEETTDLILIDVDHSYGKKSGIEAAAELSSRGKAPVVCVTGREDTGFHEKIKSVSRYGIILKGYAGSVLLGTLTIAFELFRSRKLLERKELEAREIIDNIDSAILRYDSQGGVTFFNRGAEKIFGYRAEEVLGSSGISLINPEIDSQGIDHREMLRDIFAHPDRYGYNENENECKDGTRIWMAWRNKAVYDEGGNILFIQSIGTDITRHKEIETDLRESLKEKDALMKELNHRVKNNLAIISSLIRLKDSSLGDSVDLSDIQHQIDAVRIVHEKLYRTDGITHINLRDYITDLLASVFVSFTLQPVRIENGIKDLRMRTKTVIPIGLIINELATNAIKHGFTGDGETVFSVGLEEDHLAGEYILSVSNTGTPFPEHIDLNHPGTLGLRLILGLVAQLDGTMDLKKRPHPVFTIRFPLENN